MIIKSKHNGYSRDGIRLYPIDSGGGGGTPEKQTTVVDIPDWAKPYAKESLGKAQALSESPYQAYGGERIAQFTPLQQQSFERAGQQQVAGQVGFGTGLAGLAGTSSFSDPNAAASFMSPYMDAVVQRQMDSAQRQADIAATQRGAQAVRAGAFGGSRQAIENAEAARALASQKGQIQEQGLQSAFERAQQQFNQEQSTRLNAAQTLGQLGQQQFGQQMDITGQQQQFGGIQRQATQDILSQQYQDFLNQQRAPYDQLAFMSSMIRGTPLGQTTTMYQPPASQTSQLIGLGTAAAGAYGAYQGAQKAAGGEVKSYAAGGIASLLDDVDSLSDAQLAQMQQGEQRPLTAAAVAEEIMRRQAIREDGVQQQAMMAQAPQTTVAEEELAGLSALPAPNLENMDEATMAGGGIVAFEGGGTIRLPAGTSSQEAELVRMQNPDQTVVVEGQGAVYDAIKRGFFYNSDVEAQKARANPTVVAQTPAAAAMQGGGSGRRAGLEDPRLQANTVSAMTKALEKAAAPVTEENVDRGTTAGHGGLPQLKGMQATTTGGLADLKAQVEDINKSRTDAANAAVERAKAQEAEMGEYGVEEGKRLKAREDALKGAEDKNFNMALIEAGLAMMSGTSANAFENIGKGALVGTKAYTTGVERIQNRKEKLDEAVVALENAKRSDKRVSQERMDRLQANVDNAATANAEALYNFGSKTLDMSRDDARYATDVALKQAQIAASNRPSSEMQLIERIMKEEKIPFAQAVKRASELGSKPAAPFNFKEAYADYLAKAIGPAMTYEQYVRQFALTNTPPQGAAVLPR